jgi:hypothetical protein
MMVRLQVRHISRRHDLEWARDRIEQGQALRLASDDVALRTHAWPRSRVSGLVRPLEALASCGTSLDKTAASRLTPLVLEHLSQAS